MYRSTNTPASLREQVRRLPAYILYVCCSLTFMTAVTSNPRDMSTHENMATPVMWNEGVLYTTARLPSPGILCARGGRDNKWAVDDNDRSLLTDYEHA